MTATLTTARQVAIAAAAVVLEKGLCQNGHFSDSRTGEVCALGAIKTAIWGSPDIDFDADLDPGLDLYDQLSALLAAEIEPGSSVWPDPVPALNRAAVAAWSDSPTTDQRSVVVHLLQVGLGLPEEG